MSAGFPAEPQEQAPGAVAALVLGILSVVMCPLCGPVAWHLGRKAEHAVDASGGRLGSRGLGTAGKVLGIIGTIFVVLLIVYAIVIIAVETDFSSSSA